MSHPLRQDNIPRRGSQRGRRGTGWEGDRHRGRGQSFSHRGARGLAINNRLHPPHAPTVSRPYPQEPDSGYQVFPNVDLHAASPPPPPPSALVAATHAALGTAGWGPNVHFPVSQLSLYQTTQYGQAGRPYTSLPPSSSRARGTAVPGLLRPATPAYGHQLVPVPHLNYLPYAAISALPYGPTPARTTPEGYTLSSTAPGQWYSEPLEPAPEYHDSKGVPDSAPALKPQKNKAPLHGQLRQRIRCESCRKECDGISSFEKHKSLHMRCSEPGCKFEALPKIVQTHEEDRHLRFQPGREPGPPVPDGPPESVLQGLGYVLDDPTLVETWLQERKKRWPSAARITEKEKQRSERVAAGLEAPRLPPLPRRGRLSELPNTIAKDGRTPNGTSRLAKTAPANRNDHADGSIGRAYSRSSVASASSGESDLESNESSFTPEETTSKQAPAPVPATSSLPITNGRVLGGGGKQTCVHWLKGSCQYGPKCKYAHPPNQRGSHRDLLDASPSSLLAKLLANEIEHDVSDMLQVIHFLVTNDFLDNVELRPGQADEQLIQSVPDDIRTGGM